MNRVALDIVGLSYSQSQKDAYVLILGEIDGKRRIPIIIGSSEAQAIAIEMENLKTPRPLTHDLIKLLGDRLNFTITEVFIYKFEDGVFYSRLTIQQNGELYEIDSRTSDAAALATRFHCPIYTTEDIISRAGITIDISSDDEPEEEESSMTEEELHEEEKRLEFIFDSKEELEKKLEDAINNEDYELASIIRDELRSRE